MLSLAVKPLVKNCLGCSHYIGCKDPLKSVLYICSRFKGSVESQSDGVERLFNFMDMPSIRPVKDDFDERGSIIMHEPESSNSGFDITRVINDIIKNDTVVSSDIKINDRDFEQAPNFYTWCVSDKFLKQKPFVEQALIGTRVLAEYCPDCTDMEWMDHTHKVGDSLHTFEKKIALLDKGVCPHCKKGRSYFVRKGRLNYYHEAAVSAGQRSGKSAWVGMISSYLTHLQIKLQKPNEVYGLLNANILHGTFVALTYAQAKDTLWEPFYGHLTDSKWFSGYNAMLDEASVKYGEELYKLKDTFCLTGDTLVDTTRGLVRMDNLKVGDRCKEKKGRYKTISNWIHTGKKQIKKVLTADGYSVRGSNDHPILTLNANFEPVWKEIKHIKSGDFLAINYAKSKVLKQVKLNFSLGENSSLELVSLINEIAKQKSFKGSDIKGYTRGTYRNTLGNLVQCGLLLKEETRRSRTYTITKTFSVKKALDCVISYSNPRLEPIKYKIPKLLDKDLAKVLGYMVAEGSYNNNFVFSNKDPKVLKDFIQSYTKVFEHTPSVSQRIDCSNVNIQHKGVTEFLRYAGLTKSLSSTKSIPWCILQAPLSVQVSFLQSLFEGDGNINSLARTISYTSISKKLLEQLQILLLQHGILCKVRGIYLHLDRLNSIKFINSIGFSFKKQKLDITSIKKYKPKFNTCATRLPNTLGIISGSANARKGIFIENTHNHLGILQSLKTEDSIVYKNIKKLIGAEIAWAEVTSVENEGFEDVYDITVDSKDHLFTANGILVHNCMYRHRRLLIYPAGPDKRTLRGRTRFFSSVDELGWFDNNANTAKVKMNANEVYIALERSLLTVRASASNLLKQGFDNVPTGYFLNISSPSSVRDKIMELVRKSQGSRKLYGVIKPTWEMNPKVPRSALAEEFKNDPVAAMRDYGAQPPLTANPFISSVSEVEDCFGEKTNPILMSHAQKKSKDGTIRRYANVDKIKPSSKPSVLAIDAGYSNNSFACCNAYLDSDGYPRIALLAEIMPLPGIPLNYSLIYQNVLVPIVDARNVVLMAADRWNSLKILSDIEEECSIETKQYSLKYPDMQLFKSHIIDHQITFPRPKWTLEQITKYDQSKYPECFVGNITEHFILQMLTVQDTGSQVIKGDALTDDLMRAAMLAVTMLLDPNNAELWAAADKAPVQTEMSKMAVYRGASGGGTRSSGSSGSGQPGGGSPLGTLKQRG